MQFRNLPIRRKVTLSVVLVFAVTLTAATAGFTIVSAITFREQAVTQINALSELIAVGVNSSVLFEDSEEAITILERLRRESEIVEAHVIKPEPEGFRPFASSPRGAALPDEGVLTARGAQAREGGMWFVRELEDAKGNAFAVLAVHSDLRVLRQQRRRALAVALLSALVLLALSLGLAGLLRRSVTEPIALLAETARTISARHDPAAGIRAPKLADDEVGALADHFNRMLDTLEEQAGALHEKEERYRLLVENSNELVCELDADGAIVYTNPNYETILGFEPGELLGCRALSMAHPEEQADLAERMQQHEAEAVFRHRHKDGSWRWLESAGRRYRTSRGEERGVIISRDITERRRAEQEQEKLRAQLVQAQKMESVGRLAGGVAHDFNNMLSVIIGHAEVAAEQTTPGDPLHASLEQIQSAAGRSADLTRQLLGFARLQTIAPKVVDLNETIDGTLKMLRRMIGENISLEWRPGAHVPRLNIDPSQIDQILTNLCVNARDAIADVGQIAIETGSTVFGPGDQVKPFDIPPGEYATLRVSDTGRGMAPGVLEHIFEPFFTTKAIGEGTGLGLATVYGAVKQNRGFISACSEPGHGTTFTIHLPRHDGPDETALPATQAEPPARGSETILLVEDEPAILQLGQHVLEGLGYSVLAAGTPGRALELAATHDPIDLLMTDVIMPELNGRELADRVTAIHPGIRRLFMSGYPADAIAHRGVLESGLQFIQKPFSRQELAARIRSLLDGEPRMAGASSHP
jgi:PAS domain S-box-containing protein